MFHSFSESKEAIAHVEEIEKEIRLSLQQCARKMRTHLSKKEKKAKARDKFLLITKILPAIAEKVSNIVGKPKPSLDEIITQIMNIVWIDDSIEEDGELLKSTINVTNYRKMKHSFYLFAEIPGKEFLDGVEPEPERIEENYIMWHVDIDPKEKKSFVFRLKKESEFDENNLYIEGLNPVYVIGAEKWEGE